MEQFIVSARKYRPLTFESVVGQDSIATTLKNAIQRQHLAHAYLFCGPRGVGKTTCARIFAKTINCLSPTPNMEACGECESCRSFAEGRSYSIHELDAASNNSVDDIRTLTDQVRVPPQIGRYSVYIIDEVHMLSAAAFNAFLKTLEEPPAHAIFILATTEKHKILPTILSRCQIFDFKRITISDMEKYLGYIAGKENITAEPEALNVIAQKADGAMRDALSIFDQVVTFCGNDITYAQVIENLNVLDYEYYFRLTDAFLKHDYKNALMLFDEILAKGFEAQHFVAGLSSHFRDLLVCKDSQTLPLLEVGTAIAKHYQEQAANCSIPFLFEALQIANVCETGYKMSGNPRLHVELCLVNLSNIDPEKKNETIDVDAEESVPKAPVKSPELVSHSTPVENSTLSKNTETAEIQTVENNPAKPVTTAPPKSISLKAALKENKKEKPEETPKERPANVFTQSQLEEAWARLVAQKDIDSRVSAALANAQPTLIEGATVRFIVLNAVQKTWIEQNLANKILQFLHQDLQNYEIKLAVEVAPSEGGEQTPRLYMPDDKFKFLSEKYPAVKYLKQTLGLEVR